MPGVLPVKPLPERRLDGLGQGLIRLGSKLPGQPASSLLILNAIEEV